MGKHFFRGLVVLGSLLVFCLAGSANAEWISFLRGAAPSPIKIEVIKSDLESTIIKYELSGVERDLIMINGEQYSKISLPGASLTDIKGNPELPRFGRSIMIPVSSDVQFKVIEKETKEISLGVISPSKGPIFRDINPEDVPYTFGRFYRSQENFPREQFSVGKPFQFRDIRGVNLQFIPIQYQARSASLKIFTKFVVEIKTPIKRSKKFSILNKGNVIGPDFVQLYQDHLVNYRMFMDTVRTRGSKFIPEQTRVMVITHPNFAEAIQPYVAWKTQKGLFVKMVVLENGTTYEKIKEMIKNEYVSSGLSYVILVGDAEFVPFHPGTAGNAVDNEADPMYALTDGDDNYPDLFVSRMSVKSVADVENIVARSVNYEKNPDLNGDWYGKGTGIASDQGDPTDFERAEILRQIMESWHYKAVDKIYDPGANASMVTEVINSGRGYINYIGHGSETSWGTTGFSNLDIDNLNNSNKLPFIVSVACVNGHFNNGDEDSYAEHWLKAGTKDDPKGAIAIFASSTNQAWVEPTVGQKEIATLLTQNKATTIGGLFFNGAIAILDDNAAEAIQTVQTWHIFGDATLNVRTAKPTAISIELPTVVMMAQDKIVINAKEKDISLGVTQDGHLVASGRSGDDGLIEANILEPLKVGTMQMTFTGFDKIPLITDVTVTPPDGPYLQLGSYKANGRPANLVYSGENVDLGFSLANVGKDPTAGGTLKIEEITGPATIDVGTFNLPAMNVGEKVEINDSLRFAIVESAALGDLIKLKISWTINEGKSAETSVAFIVSRGLLKVAGIDFNAGPNQGGIKPGEHGQVFVTVSNSGTEVMRDMVLQGKINTCVDSLDGDLHVDTLEPGQTVRIDTPLNFNISAACKNGDKVQFSLIGSYQSLAKRVDIESEGQFYAGVVSTREFEFANLGLAIPDQGPVLTKEIPVSDISVINDVSVQIGIKHSWIGDLVVRLVHPNGTTVVLHDKTGGQAVDINKVYSVSGEGGVAVSDLAKLKDLDGNGIWKLEVQDVLKEYAGTLEYVKLVIRTYQ